MDFVTIEAQSERVVIAPELGCQCFGYRVGSLEIIAAPPSVEALREHPFRSGIPILFPWPGRVAHGKFDFDGRQIVLPINEPAHSSAIHGLTWNCAFRVAKRGPNYALMELDSASDPNLSRIWPYPFVLEIDYEVADGLRIKFRVRNSGKSEMPFGFGAHPYFNAPLGKGGSRESLSLQMPAAGKRWPLDSGLIPTAAPQPVEGKFDLRQARVLGAETYDDVFKLDSARDPSAPCARMVDPAARLAIEVRADAPFEDFVIYAPPGNPVVAMEPYTCAPDTFNLSARGVESGMRRLAPGATFEAGFEIRVAAP
ncbi:MAG: aldose epimerase family protein [Candidatus Binataceae bacterium]